MRGGIKHWLIRAIALIVVVALLGGVLVYNKTDLKLPEASGASQAQTYAAKQLLLTADYAAASRMQRMEMYVGSLLRGRKNAEDCLLAAEISLVSGDYKSALSLTKSALAKSEDSEEEKARLSMQCGYLEVLLGQTDEACADIEQGVRVTGDPDAYLVLAMLRQEQGSDADCAEYINYYLDNIGEGNADPAAGSIALLTGDWQLASDVYARLYAQDATAENLLYRGITRYMNGQTDVAITDLDAYITIEGPESAACELCGLIAYRNGRYSESLSYFETAVGKLNADQKACYYYILLNACAIQDYAKAAEAADAYMAATSAKPEGILSVNLPVDEMTYLRKAGTAYAKIQDYEKAMNCFDQALAAASEDADVRKAKISVQMALGQWQEALAEIETLNDDSSSVRYMKALCLYNLEDLSGAEQEFQSVIDAETDAAVIEQCEGYLSEIKTRMLEETK